MADKLPSVLLKAGEDPRFIARRLIISASEDVGNADPRALLVAHAALGAVELAVFREAGTLGRRLLVVLVVRKLGRAGRALVGARQERPRWLRELLDGPGVGVDLGVEGLVAAGVAGKETGGRGSEGSDAGLADAARKEEHELAEGLEVGDRRQALTSSRELIVPDVELWWHHKVAEHL